MRRPATAAHTRVNVRRRHSEQAIATGPYPPPPRHLSCFYRELSTTTVVDFVFPSNGRNKDTATTTAAPLRQAKPAATRSRICQQRLQFSRTWAREGNVVGGMFVEKRRALLEAMVTMFEIFSF